MHPEQPSTAPEEKGSSRQTFLALSAVAALTAGVIGTFHYGVAKVLDIHDVQKIDDPEEAWKQANLRRIRAIGDVGLAIEGFLGAGWVCAELQKLNRRHTTVPDDAETEPLSPPLSLTRGPHCFVSPEDILGNQGDPPFQRGPRILDVVAS